MDTIQLVHLPPFIGGSNSQYLTQKTPSWPKRSGNPTFSSGSNLDQKIIDTTKIERLKNKHKPLLGLRAPEKTIISQVHGPQKATRISYQVRGQSYHVGSL